MGSTPVTYGIIAAIDCLQQPNTTHRYVSRMTEESPSRTIHSAAPNVESNVV